MQLIFDDRRLKNTLSANRKQHFFKFLLSANSKIMESMLYVNSKFVSLQKTSTIWRHFLQNKTGC